MLICWQQASRCSSMTAPSRPASNLTMLTWPACRCVSWSVSVRSSMTASNLSCVPSWRAASSRLRKLYGSSRKKSAVVSQSCLHLANNNHNRQLCWGINRHVLAGGVHVQPGGGPSIEIESHVDGQVRMDKVIGQLIEGKDQAGADDEQHPALLVHRHHAAARARRICAELRAFVSWQNEHGGRLRCLLQLLAWTIGLLDQVAQSQAPLAIDQEHTSESAVGCAENLPIGDNQASSPVLLVEVSSIDDRCRLFFAHPVSQVQWMCGLIPHAQAHMAHIKSHDGHGVIIASRALPVFIPQLNSCCDLAPHVQLWCARIIRCVVPCRNDGGAIDRNRRNQVTRDEEKQEEA